MLQRRVQFLMIRQKVLLLVQVRMLKGRRGMEIQRQHLRQREHLQKVELLLLMTPLPCCSD
jgi:hypothetical protein